MLMSSHHAAGQNRDIKTANGLHGSDYEQWRLLGCYAVFLRSVRRLLVTASIVHSSPILVSLMKEALSSSETSVLTRATKRPRRRHSSFSANRLFENVSQFNFGMTNKSKFDSGEN
jgi:hypothetical protein